MMRRWSPAQWALRATIAGGITVALWSTALAGTPPRTWLLVLVAGLSVAFARLPDSSIGTAAMGIVVVWWGVALRDGLQPAGLLAAGGLLASHVAAVLVSYGPDELPVDPATVRLWALRAGGVFLLAPALWLVATILRDRPETPGVWVAGLLVALAATLVIAFRSAEED